MIIDLASVTSTPRPLSAEIDGELIDLGDDGRVAGIARFDGEVFGDDTKAHVRGTVRSELQLRCTRCGEELTRQVEIPFEDVFVDTSEETGDAEIEGEQLDEQLVDGGEIDLTDIVREQILLDLPEQVFCREDCRGLCPQCAVNLNSQDCKCGDEDIDPRWAALKDLS